MARHEIENAVQLSVLDRLIDEEPDRGIEAPMSRAQSLRQLKASLRRDLEWLLNSRQRLDAEDLSSGSSEVTVLDYGLPDVTSLALHSARDQNRLLKAIESAIEAFEPRLQNVRVTMQPAVDTLKGFHFMVEGLLKVDPAPEHVYFDTRLEVSTGEYEVKGEGSA